jgi:hypothetical protein
MISFYINSCMWSKLLGRFLSMRVGGRLIDMQKGFCVAFYGVFLIFFWEWSECLKFELCD